MSREFAQTFYQSQAWIKTRKAFKKSKFGMCETCKQPNGYIVHHKIHLNPLNINNPDITLSWSNLMLLCIDCHNKEHMKKYLSIDPELLFNEQGELIKKDLHS